MEMPGDEATPLSIEKLLELARANHAVHQTAPAPQSMADRLRERRHAVGLSQDQLAVACGVTKGSISAWESGKTDNIGLQSFLKLLTALETDFHYLVFGRRGVRAPQPNRRKA